jgi:hypothetical protein
MNTYRVTYWTGKTELYRAHTLVNAAKRVYTLAYLRRYSEATGEVLRVYGEYGDLCATIEKHDAARQDAQERAENVAREEATYREVAARRQAWDENGWIAEDDH